MRFPTLGRFALTGLLGIVGGRGTANDPAALPPPPDLPAATPVPQIPQPMPSPPPVAPVPALAAQGAYYPPADPCPPDPCAACPPACPTPRAPRIRVIMSPPEVVFQQAQPCPPPGRKWLPSFCLPGKPAPTPQGLPAQPPPTGQPQGLPGQPAAAPQAVTTHTQQFQTVPVTTFQTIPVTTFQTIPVTTYQTIPVSTATTVGVPGVATQGIATQGVATQGLVAQGLGVPAVGMPGFGVQGLGVAPQSLDCETRMMVALLRAACQVQGAGDGGSRAGSQGLSQEKLETRFLELELRLEAVRAKVGGVMLDMENAKPILAGHEKDIRKHEELLNRIERTFKEHPDKLPPLAAPTAPEPKAPPTAAEKK